MIILASSSPRRREILGRFFEIKVYPANVEERSTVKDSREKSLDIARKKALSVSSKFPGATIVAADTMVIFRGKTRESPGMLKKPEKC